MHALFLCVVKQTFNGEFFFPFRFVWIFRSSDKIWIIHFTIYLFSGHIDRLFLSTFDCRYLVLIEKVKRIYRKQLSELIVLSTAETYQGQSHVAEALWILVTCGILTNLKKKKIALSKLGKF